MTHLASGGQGAQGRIVCSTFRCANDEWATPARAATRAPRVVRTREILSIGLSRNWSYQGDVRRRQTCTHSVNRSYVVVVQLVIEGLFRRFGGVRALSGV